MATYSMRRPYQYNFTTMEFRTEGRDPIPSEPDVLGAVIVDVGSQDTPTLFNCYFAYAPDGHDMPLEDVAASAIEFLERRSWITTPIDFWLTHTADLYAEWKFHYDKPPDSVHSTTTMYAYFQVVL